MVYISKKWFIYFLINLNKKFTNQEKTSKASLSKGPPSRLKFPRVHSGFFLLPPSRVRFSHSRITNYNCGLSWNAELNHAVY